MKGPLLVQLLAGLLFATPEAFAVDFAGLLQPRLSPDETAIVASYQGAIYRWDLTGEIPGRPVVLTAQPGWDSEPVWSPDGKKIAYLSSARPNAGQVRLMDATTGASIALPKSVQASGKLYFSADGKRILGRFFGAGRPGWYDLETGERTLITISPDDDDRYRRKRVQFALSGSGDALIFATHRDEPFEQGGNQGPQADVWRCAADGSSPEQLFTWPARIHDLCWPKDQEGFYAVTDRGATHNDIWFIPFEEPLRLARKITSGNTDEDRPTKVTRDGPLYFTTNATGPTGLLQIAPNQDLPSPVFAPDSSQVPEGHTAKLKIRCLDQGNPVTARIALQQLDGKFHAPPGSLYQYIAGQGHFQAAETEFFPLPPGDYTLTARRGLEYRANTLSLSLQAGESKTIDIPLERWTNLAAESWYSGENHVHANYGYGEWYRTPASILQLCQGENLNVCNAVIANSDGEAIFDRGFFLGQVDPRSTKDCLMYWGQEFRSTIWGHMTLSSLSQLVEPIMTGFPGTTNPWDVPTNGEIGQRTIDQEGLIGYTHPAANILDLYDQPYSAKGLPVDAALNKVMLMDVHGHTYPGSCQLWYRLLNCDLPVAASSGTDVFLNRIVSFPPGFARTYVHLPEGLTYDHWTKGQRQGRSFITNGPILNFEVDGKLGMGASLTLDAPGAVKVKAKAEFQFPLDKAELIQNGEVISTLQLAEDGLRASFEGEVDVRTSGWVAFRVSGPANVETIRDPSAHTNPCRFHVEGHPNPFQKRDAAYFLEWIDRLEADLLKRDRFPTEQHRNHVLAYLDSARVYYQSLAKQ